MSVFKRLLVGEPFPSGRRPSLSLSKRYAIPLLAVNPISSLAYAPEQVFLVLGLAGTAAYAFSVPTGLGVAALMVLVIAAYRYTVQAYPGGGGDYRVVTANFGLRAGRLAAAALVLDYILTVAVSVTAAVIALGFLMPGLQPWRGGIAVAAIAALAAYNLRGLKVSGRFAAGVTAAFVTGVAAILIVGLLRLGAGEDLTAASAEHDTAEAREWTTAALLMLCVRAFAAGSVAVTGIETFTTRVRFFRPPRGRNAAAAITVVGGATVALFAGIVVLARLTGAQSSAGPGPASFIEHPLLADLADTVFGGSPAAVVPIMLATAAVLLLAANTAFVGFPRLASVFAEDSLLPRQLHKRGDRLVYSNGILILAVAAAVLVILFGGRAHELIGLYIVGVFLSMVLSHAAMARHWRRVLDVERDRGRRARAHRGRATALAAAAACAVVLVVVVLADYRRGGWIAVLIIGGCYLLMRFIAQHYTAVRGEIELPPGRPKLPARNHAIVLVSSVNLPLMRMLSYAKATRPDTITGLSANVDAAASRHLLAEWERRGITVPLTVVDSPYREITGPIVDYVKALRRDAPRDVVTVYLPEYVVGQGPQRGRLARGYFNWSTSLLHNQTTKALRRQLKYEPGVMICTVPWILGESTEPPPLRRVPK